MAYKTEELRQKAIKAIKKHQLVFIEEVVSHLPCSKQTFYDHKLDKADGIKDALEQNKISTKQFLRREWKTSDSATERIALYKLLATDEEFARLTNSSQKIEVEGVTVNLSEA